MSIKLLIADDQEIVRLGLKSFLSDTEIEIIGEASAGGQVVSLAASCQPDVVLVAAHMRGESGLSALNRIKQELPSLPVIVMANQDHPAYLAQAHALGAAGFLVKSVCQGELIDAIRAVAAGKQFWTRTHMRRVTGVLGTPRVAADVEAPLTLREMEVLRGITDGQTNRQIADSLGISYETVKEHVQHILQKVGVSDRTQAAVWAVRSRLVGEPGRESGQ